MFGKHLSIGQISSWLVKAALNHPGVLLSMAMFGLTFTVLFRKHTVLGNNFKGIFTIDGIGKQNFKDSF